MRNGDRVECWCGWSAQNVDPAVLVRHREVCTGPDGKRTAREPTVYYLSPNPPTSVSGGTRNLYDHVAILNDNGIHAQVVYNHQLLRLDFDDRDLIVVPEVYGELVRDLFPDDWRRVCFVQNSYFAFDDDDGADHPFMTAPNLVAILTDSEHTTDRIHTQFPDLEVPVIRTHSSANGRDGHDAGWSYGEWPREKVVVFFQYKHEAVNQVLFDQLNLPDGWRLETLSGLDDDAVKERMRTAGVFVAANQREGMCAPTCEAMIAGTPIVCWTGGGPEEYLRGRAVIARQDDLADLRVAIADTCHAIDAAPDLWAVRTREWSDWFQRTYSRERQVDEICRIMKELL